MFEFSEGDPTARTAIEQPHELREFVAQVSTQLAAEYARIRRRAREDPGTAGDEGEENWRDLFEQWLPPELAVVTKGRILGHNGELSPQVDVLVLRPGYPRSLLHKKTYLAGGVLAAFECKLTLKPEHVRSAAAVARAVHALTAPRHGTPHDEASPPITFGLLAHTTSLRRNSAGRIDSLLAEELAEADSPLACLNTVCVADTATWHFTALLFARRAIKPELWDQIRSDLEFEDEGGIRGFYMRWLGWPGNEVAPRPLYLLIQDLLQHAAWEAPVYRELARYWELTSQAGRTSLAARSWPLSIFSETVMSGIRGGRVTSGEPWSPWGVEL